MSRINDGSINKKKNKIIFVEMVVRASDGEHLCAELVGRYLKNEKHTQLSH